MLLNRISQMFLINRLPLSYCYFARSSCKRLVHPRTALLVSVIISYLLLNIHTHRVYTYAHEHCSRIREGTVFLCVYGAAVG